MFGRNIVHAAILSSFNDRMFYPAVTSYDYGRAPPRAVGRYIGLKPTTNGNREMERRQRQITAGKLKVSA